ncbi:hypothetical protein ELI_2312 [Eubacterium callanderi]|uniref:Uncharacterized protein n=1 Tax=Eubacterium callanderi TaxID=53442 RepID=E3GNQ2_9FIRM|nr:hypothetical protein ELI_2312 [Eubacterium callanderi]
MIPDRLPQRLDLFSYLDKRPSLGLLHFFDSLMIRRNGVSCPGHNNLKKVSAGD